MSTTPPELSCGCEDLIVQGVRVWSGDLVVTDEYLPSFPFNPEDRRDREISVISSCQVDPICLCEFVHGYV